MDKWAIKIRCFVTTRTSQSSTMSLNQKISKSVAAVRRMSKYESSRVQNLLVRVLDPVRSIVTRPQLSGQSANSYGLRTEENSEARSVWYRISRHKTYVCNMDFTNYGLQNNLANRDRFTCRHFSTATTYLLAKKAQKSKAKSKKLSLNEEEAEGIVNFTNLKQRMEQVLKELDEDFAAKVPLRITAGFMDKILVETEKGKKIPLYELAQVKANKDTFSIEIQDHFPNAAKIIATAIAETGFNMQPSIKEDSITLPIPMFSSDQRSTLEKISKGIANQGKDALRKVRQKGMVDIRNNKEGQSKDLIRRIEGQVQQLTDHYNDKVEIAFEKKMKEINK